MTANNESKAAPHSAPRTFGRRLCVAALGGAAVGPLVGSSSAQAATPAYTDSPNTFTADQTIMARLSVGGKASAPLTVTRQDPGAAVEISAHTMALGAGHSKD